MSSEVGTSSTTLDNNGASGSLHLQNQLAIARREINNLRQQLNNLNHVHRKELECINTKLTNWQCMSCKFNQSTLSQSVFPVAPSHDFTSNYIGRISTNFPEKRGTPRQPGICKDLTAKLTLDNNIFTNPEHALQGLEEYSHMWILFHFHKNDLSHSKAKVAPPRLNGIKTGVFATRSPHRPSPLGLSLVKIDRIMENTIYFSGVDMINDTPVLDIKPYIPHYDNPVYLNQNSGNSLAETIASTSRIIEQAEEVNVSIEGQSQISDNDRTMDGEENERRDQVVGPPGANHVQSGTEESYFIRSNSRMGEREAPDGEEEESPRNVQSSAPPLQPASTPEGHIRVPSWIDQPLVPRLTVVFKDRALAQLCQLGQEGEEKKITITNVLREDPRSVYLRDRWGSHCYVFRIADLHVSCKFNDNSHLVTVYQVFQNDAPQGGEE